MKRSASAFAFGHNRVIFRCLNPRVPANVVNSCPLKGGPLLLLTWSGIPNKANILSSCSMTVDAEVECTNSTTGKREY